MTLHEVCDAGLPNSSQEWYRIMNAIITGIETVLIITFIYLHRKSTYFRQTLPHKLSKIPKQPIYDDYFDDNDIDIDMDNININNNDNNDINNDNNMDNNDDILTDTDIETKEISYITNKTITVINGGTGINNSNVISTPTHTNTILNGLNGSITEYDINNNSDREYSVPSSYYNNEQNRGYNIDNDFDKNYYYKNEGKNDKKEPLLKKAKNFLSNNIPLKSDKTNVSDVTTDVDSEFNRKRVHKSTMDVIENNEDEGRIFFVLLPIYYKFLFLILGYCIVKLIYMIIIASGAFDDFGYNDEKYSLGRDYKITTKNSLTKKEVISGLIYAAGISIEFSIFNFVTFWFLQPSSGKRAFKFSIIPAILIGYVLLYNYIYGYIIT